MRAFKSLFLASALIAAAVPCHAGTAGAGAPGAPAAPAALRAVPAPSPAGPSAALKDGDPVSIGEYRVLHSETLGEDRTLAVSLPRSYGESAMAYPVLYLLYGDNIRGYLAEAVNAVNTLADAGEIPEMIIVGVLNVDRYRDLRPADTPRGPSRMKQFAAFLSGELKPFIDGEYRTKDYRVLVGPQAGACYGLYAFFDQPGLFNAFLLENPFYFREERQMFMDKARAFSPDSLPSFTFLRIRCVDRTRTQDHGEAVEFAHGFEKAMGGSKGNDTGSRRGNLQLVMNYIQGNLDFVPSPGIKDGLRKLFADYMYPEGSGSARLEDYKDYYTKLSEKYGAVFEVPELPLVMRSDELTREGKNDEALLFLDFIIKQNPVSLNGYWRLANLYRAAGEREKAIAAYKKCLELMPNMTPARQILEQMESE